jgi:membrane-bound serine protease (ClpP class)
MVADEETAVRKLLAVLAFAVQAVVVAQPRVVAVDVDGMIHPITAEIINRTLEQAKAEHAAAVLIRLNTPGGLLNATREIDQALLKSPVPVITYVTPSGGRAASAGFFILEAGDIAAMAPGTNTGAASPVLLGQEMDKIMRQKVENDSAAALRSMMSNRGRNAAVGETAVREAKSFTEREALDNRLIDLIARDQDDLFKQLNGREITRFEGGKVRLDLANAIVTEYRPSFRERLISAIADPNIGFILLVVGALGLYVEFSSPGLIFAGVGGAISLLLGLSALSVLPINWIGVALLILSLALFVLEAKVTSHGVLGIGGTVAMIFGALLLVEAPPAFRIHLSTALATSIPFALITMFLVSLVVKAHRNKAMTGDQGMLFEIGEARTALVPRGKIFVHGEYWDAESSAPVQPGSRVRVVAVDGLLLKVEPYSN